MAGNGTDVTEVERLRRLYEQESSRVRELESAQRQLELYADDLQRTFRELRRQLSNMNELHQISTVIGSVLDPNEVMARTLDGLARLVEHDRACIYVIGDDDLAVRAADRGPASRLPPRRVRRGEGPIGLVLAAGESVLPPSEALSLTVPLRAGGTTVGALHLVRERGPALSEDERKLIELVAAEAAAAIQNARLYEQTRRLATTDPHTGLFNYRYFREALSMELARARRLGYVIGLLMIDLDNFKQVNDTWGHLAGDQVLRQVADQLRCNLRRTDVLARYGGEEFAVILPGLGAAGVYAVGEKLCRAVRLLRRSQCGDQAPARITISVGGVSRAPSEVDEAQLVSAADTALYQVKRSGKDGVCVLPSGVRPAAAMESVR